MNSLELIKLNKHYGRKHALKNFSFTFTNGIYGLLGPNGAGKSTLMHRSVKRAGLVFCH